MRVLLTGGSGFIGRNIFEALKDRYSIFAPTHKELDIMDYVRVADFIKEKKIDVIVHPAVKGGDFVFEQTMRMFISINRNIDKVDRIIHFGSGAEYFKARDLVKVKEAEIDNYIPDDAYGFTKYLCNQIIRKEKNMVNLRLFGIYGKYEDYRFKFISNTIVRNLMGLNIRIVQDVIFDYLYINDLVDILRYFLENPFDYPDYNVTPTESISLKQIANIVNEISNIQSEISIENNGYNFQYTGDNSRLRGLIPDFKFTSYREGIKELFSCYSENLTNLDRNAIEKDEYFKQCKIRPHKKS